jgi:hypothetical protein
VKIVSVLTALAEKAARPPLPYPGGYYRIGKSQRRPKLEASASFSAACAAIPLPY